MTEIASAQELHHEIFGSILDRTEMSPFLLLRTADYPSALKQVTKMMRNRGFDTINDELQESETERARKYIEQVYKYVFEWMFPFLTTQLESLEALASDNEGLYRDCLQAIAGISAVLNSEAFRKTIDHDPRHLFLLASSRKYPHVFRGYNGELTEVPCEFQQAACAILKMAHLVKSIEEDSQDIDDYAELGFFLQAKGQSLDDLYHYAWDMPSCIPESESAQKAFVKISTFFHKLKESMAFDPNRGALVFNSGDGVEVEISEIKARLKSPQSMFTKLGKNVEGEAYDIRDILAITFILKSRDDTLKLFHALQKRGVILQENTASHSIAQTLFDTPEEMREAVRRLMIGLSQSEGRYDAPDEDELLLNANKFYRALSINTAKNIHSSSGHKKFQCKINFSLPIHRKADTNEIIVPGTPLYAARNNLLKKTQQYTLGLELRISDEESWRISEQKGEAHHDAYKFRQLVPVMNRLFKDVFLMPEEKLLQLRQDQIKLFSEMDNSP